MTNTTARVSNAHPATSHWGINTRHTCEKFVDQLERANPASIFPRREMVGRLSHLLDTLYKHGVSGEFAGELLADKAYFYIELSRKMYTGTPDAAHAATAAAEVLRRVQRSASAVTFEHVAARSQSREPIAKSSPSQSKRP